LLRLRELARRHRSCAADVILPQHALPHNHPSGHRRATAWHASYLRFLSKRTRQHRHDEKSDGTGTALIASRGYRTVRGVGCSSPKIKVYNVLILHFAESFLLLLDETINERF